MQIQRKIIGGLIIAILMALFVCPVTAERAENESASDNALTVSRVGNRVITTEPEIQLNLEVEASCLYGELQYQWFYAEGPYSWEKVEIPGATSAIYSVVPKKTNSYYTCVVTDCYGNQQEADFYVMIDNQLSVRAVEGYQNIITPYDSITFHAEASCIHGELTYKWSKSIGMAPGAKEDIPDITGPTYTMDPGTIETTSYYCEVYDQYGNNRTAYFGLKVDNQLTATGNTNVHVPYNTKATLEVTADCLEGELSYQWYQSLETYGPGGRLIESATNSNFITEEITAQTKYYCAVTDKYRNSNNIYFSVNVDNELTVSRIGEESRDVRPGEDTILEVAASCRDGELTIEWFTEDAWRQRFPTPVYTGAAYHIPDNELRTGRYICRVKDQYGGSEILEYWLYVNNELNAYPTSSSVHYVTHNESAALSVTASCLSGNLTYQWFKCLGATFGDQKRIAGATGTSYTTEPVKDITTYICEVYDQYGNTYEVYFKVYTEYGGKWGDLTWTLSGEDTVIISGNGAISDFYEGSISAWHAVKSNITTVIIEEGVTRIGTYAFHNFRKLTSVQIPESVTSIGWLAFGECRSLTSLTIPKSVTSIEGGAFTGAMNLQNLVIEEGNPMYTFADGLIYNNNKSVVIAALPAITEAALAESVKFINAYAFSNCYLLTSATLPEGLDRIGYHAFEDCTRLAEIHLPDSITQIGGGAFIRCGELKEMILPKSLAEIQYETFYECNQLTTITIPVSVKKIGSSAFDGYCLLSDVYYEGTEADWAAIIIEDENYVLRAATIHCRPQSILFLPENLTTIESEAFAGLTGIGAVRIPDSVTSIAEDAFSGTDVLILTPDDSYAAGWAEEHGFRHRSE